jgi:hypothetical protein
MLDASAFESGTLLTTAVPGLTLTAVQVVGELDELLNVVEPIAQTGVSYGGAAASNGFIGNFVASGNLGTAWGIQAGSALRVDVSDLARAVTVYFAPDDNDTGFLFAFSATGDLLEGQVLRSRERFALSVGAGPGLIAYVLAGYTDTGRIAALSFDPAAAQSVPEPSTWCLAAIALLLAGTAARNVVRRARRLDSEGAATDRSESSTHRR